MPTKKQLFDVWAADMALGAYGYRPDLYGDRPASKPIDEFAGQEIGTIAYDPKTDDLIVHVNDKKEDSGIDIVFP